MFGIPQFSHTLLKTDSGPCGRNSYGGGSSADWGWVGVGARFKMIINTCRERAMLDSLQNHLRLNEHESKPAATLFSIEGIGDLKLRQKIAINKQNSEYFSVFSGVLSKRYQRWKLLSLVFHPSLIFHKD